MDSKLKLTTDDQKILLLQRQIDIALEMIKLNARTSIICALCRIKKRSILQLYKEFHEAKGAELDPNSNTLPKKGLLPYDAYWVIKNPENCLLASIFYKIYNFLYDNAHTDKSDVLFNAKLLVESYKIYIKTPYVNQQKLLSINRAWSIGQQIKNSEIHFALCEKCNSNYLSIKNCPQIFKQCPLCDVFVCNGGKKKWAPIKTG